MKKTKAFSLEEDVIEAIENYKKKYNLSSASSALERIILVELAKRTEFEEMKQMMKDLKNNSTITYNNESVIENEISADEEDIPQIKNSSLGDSFKNSLASMPD